VRVEKVESQGRVRETERGVREGEGSERKRGEKGGGGGEEEIPADVSSSFTSIRETAHTLMNYPACDLNPGETAKSESVRISQLSCCDVAIHCFEQ